jgi:hypothetical protein
LRTQRYCIGASDAALKAIAELLDRLIAALASVADTGVGWGSAS